MLLNILLEQAAHELGLAPPSLPWNMRQKTLWVFCQPLPGSNSCALVAPRAFLSGWAFKSCIEENDADFVCTENVQALDSTRMFSSAAAFMTESLPLDNKQSAARLILLRQAWPSRRFELPHNTPRWLWDTLHLAGLPVEDISLTLPPDWHRAPGIMQLWAILQEHYRLAEVAGSENGIPSLRFMRRTDRKNKILVHRSGQTIEVLEAATAEVKPGTIQVWLKAGEQILELLCSKAMTKVEIDWEDHPEPREWGIFLFLQTRLGKHLWNLCTNQADLPELDAVLDDIMIHGLPIPNDAILSSLSLLGTSKSGQRPHPELLEREFTKVFGPVPELPTDFSSPLSDKPRTRRKKSSATARIVEKVFLDGVPRFPEHYLMHLYRPEQACYELNGPLEITETFFDHVTLRTKDREQTIRVSGRITAEALVLVSYSGSSKVLLPTDEDLLEGLVQRYRADLKRLWDNLARECRRVEPQRQAAVRLARKIWRQQGLPPAVFQNNG